MEGSRRGGEPRPEPDSGVNFDNARADLSPATRSIKEQRRGEINAKKRASLVDAGMHPGRQEVTKTPRELAAEAETERLYDVATNREIPVDQIAEAQQAEALRGIHVDPKAKTLRDRDLAARERARKLVERPEEVLEEERVFIETMGDLLKEGKLTQEAYDSLYATLKPQAEKRLVSRATTAHVPPEQGQRDATASVQVRRMETPVRGKAKGTPEPVWSEPNQSELNREAAAEAFKLERIRAAEVARQKREAKGDYVMRGKDRPQTDPYPERDVEAAARAAELRQQQEREGKVDEFEMVDAKEAPMVAGTARAEWSAREIALDKRLLEARKAQLKAALRAAEEEDGDNLRKTGTD